MNASDVMVFNVNVERATEQQVKKRIFQESEKEIEPEDALNLIFNYFDKKKLKVPKLK